MGAIKLHIKDRERERLSAIGSLDNFVWEKGNPIDAEQIITNPNISLYCLDDSRQEAIFTVLPHGLDLSRVPFVYQAQFDHAEYLIAVSYDTFLRLADTLEVDTYRLICIHNIGRCGSTLLSQALNEVEQVIALSEPDVFANFITLRHTPREQQHHLLQASYKFMYRPNVVGDATRYVLKLRNQCVDIMDIFIDAFPDAKHVFMYRNAIDWIASLYRLFVRSGNTDRRMTLDEAIEWQASYLNRSSDDVAGYFDHTIQSYSPITSLTISWIMMMTCHTEIVAQGYDLPAIRYEDLIMHRDEMLSAIFAMLELPDSAISQAQTAFNRDSQAGTRLAREDAQKGNVIQLPEEGLNQIKQILGKQSVINRPDIRLSGTLSE